MPHEKAARRRRNVIQLGAESERSRRCAVDALTELITDTGGRPGPPTPPPPPTLRAPAQGRRPPCRSDTVYRCEAGRWRGYTRTAETRVGVVGVQGCLIDEYDYLCARPALRFVSTTIGDR